MGVHGAFGLPEAIRAFDSTRFGVWGRLWRAGDQPTPRGSNNMADRKMPGMKVKGNKRYGKKTGAGPSKAKPQPVPRKPRGTTKGKK
jgi:hypothetical protein